MCGRKQTQLLVILVEIFQLKRRSLLHSLYFFHDLQKFSFRDFVDITDRKSQLPESKYYLADKVLFRWTSERETLPICATFTHKSNSKNIIHTETTSNHSGPLLRIQALGLNGRGPNDVHPSYQTQICTSFRW
jgi:hypothetical protein